MIVLANFLKAVAYVLDMVLYLMLFLVIGRAIISWVSPDPHNPIVRFLRDSTEPFMFPLRRRFPFLTPGGMDFTPLVLLFLIYFLREFLVGVMYDYAIFLRSKAMVMDLLPLALG